MANVGVVLASGGFTGDALRKKGLYGRFDRATADHTVACPGNTGDGLRLAEQVGGGLASSISTPAAWMPVSLIPGRSGQEAVFPHLIDRNKPGMIAVNLDGHRFANEASPYHDFVQAMHRSCRSAQGTVAFLICDQRAIDRYGLGFAKPFPVPRFHHIRSGYLFRSRTLSDLARRMEIPPEALMRTVEEFNAHARLGEDPLFGRGRGAYDRSQGDPRNRPNPSLRPLERPPFYAVRLVPGDIATFAGIRTDARARVLNASGDAIPGLYAVGADAASIMGGSYPAAGMNLGPAMTFGYIAARDLAQNSGKL